MVSKPPPIPKSEEAPQKENVERENLLHTIPGTLSNHGLGYPNMSNIDVQTGPIINLRGQNTGGAPSTSSQSPYPNSNFQDPNLNHGQIHSPGNPFRDSLPTINSSLPRQSNSSMAAHIDTSNTSMAGDFVINGLLVDRYQITKKIGQGGMGQVFSALDQRLSRQVVVKVSRTQGAGLSKEDRARFEREALKMASLNHPNIVTIYDYGEHHGDQFLVMELITGETLKSFINQKEEMTAYLFKEIITQLLKGVQDAHDHDVIHRDLKPSNLMWDTERQILKILDFGLARGVEGDTVTGTGHVHGSIQYMAPEQIKGESQGPPTDIYAVGILCFQLLSKSLPFRGENTVELMFQKLQKDPYNLLEQPQTPSWVTKELADVIRSCLNLSQEARPKSALKCLEQLLESIPLTSSHEDSLFRYNYDNEFEHSPQTSVVSNQFDTNHLSVVKRIEPKSLALSAILGGLALNLLFALFSDIGSDQPIQEIRSKSASVYFTSVDSLTSIESQVTLSVNGEKQGLTPLKLELPAGRHEVLLSHNNWSFKKSYELKDGESYWYSLPAPPALTLDLPSPQLQLDASQEEIIKVPSTSLPRPREASIKKKKRPLKRKKKYRYSPKKTKKSRLQAKKKRAHSKKRSSIASKRPNHKKKVKSKPAPSKSSSVDVPLLE
jgi:serine/threonine protein kinase